VYHGKKTYCEEKRPTEVLTYRVALDGGDELPKRFLFDTFRLLHHCA